jgi:preprotein translocase subunit SecA
MLGFIKKSLLARKQAFLKKRFCGVNIVLHPEMPMSSMNKMVALASVVERINGLEAKINKLSDGQLRARTEQFRERILEKNRRFTDEITALEERLLSVAIQEEKDKAKERLKIARNRVFEEVLPEAFAVVREAARRTIGLRHFDVQIAGGIILHEGRIAEMATGEGKTLVATLPAYLNALLKRGVHIVTVNDYLARRDAEWMGPIYESLGLSVGFIQHDMSDEDRKRAYSCDITYGTNNEFGFDYLRDNMKYSQQDLVQRPFYYAIVDEVDSILIDEARTPLIISGPAEESTDKYYIINRIVPQLKGRIILEKDQIEAKYRGQNLSVGYDYIVDEKAHTAYLTEEGETKVCSLLGIDNLHEIETMEWRHHIIQALRAHNLYRRDVDYVVRQGRVIIVDEFTGRLMPGRRWSDGLHQAVEAKEGLKIERENQTLATITFQNYFRMYEKLAGMTGTAYTEAQEFKSIYGLDVVIVPTNRPLVRTNFPDCVYKTEKEKFKAIVEEIASLYERGRPVLVGTISIEKSERLSLLLKQRGLPHQVLNAKYHEMEAQIVAQAGRFKGITIATNMAGRGTDILLGGNPDYLAKNLLRQQNIPFYQPQYVQEYKKNLEKFKRQTDIEHKKVVELGGLHVIGTERHEARRIDNQLRGRSGRQGDPGSSRFYVSLQDDLMRLFGSDRLVGIMDRLGLEEGQRIEHPWVTKSIEIAQRRVEQHNFEVRKQLLEYDNVMNKQREVVYTQRRHILQEGLLREDILDMLEDEELRRAYTERENELGQEMMRYLGQMVFLQVIDSKWKDHLYAMDKLREGIGLRAYGQRDPLIEYKREAFALFERMINSIKEEAIDLLLRLQPAKPERFRGVFSQLSQRLMHPESGKFESAPIITDGKTELPSPPSASVKTTVPEFHQQSRRKIGRNEPCPCGSGKKYKKCCGR